jgi:hypothetical protein
MKRIFSLVAVFSSLAIAAACSSSSTPDDGGTSDASNDTTQQKDASTNDATANDSGGQLTLTIDDYLAWCNVNVNGGSANTMATQTYPFPVDASVTLHGDTDNDAAFSWGYWGNVNDAGVLADGGMDINKDVSFNITSNVTLHVCCPDIGQPLSECTF